MDWFLSYLSNFWAVWLEASPWLLVGLVAAGIIHVWLPKAVMTRWMSGRGLGPVVRAALIGTPLPLCSCSVLPAALAVRRGGASKGATVSFLISTPENGADSIVLSYALLGPFMAVIRPVAAVFSAVGAGWMTAQWVKDDLDTEGDVKEAPAVKSCCCSEPEAEPEPVSSCCSAEPAPEAKSCCASETPPSTAPAPAWWRAVSYGLGKMLDDILLWLVIGLLLAALIQTLVPVGELEAWGNSGWAYLAMALVGVPMYICATASTPIAASLLIAGVNPGAVLVFLLAGPATNLATIAVVRSELGSKAVACYLGGVIIGALLMGLLTDWLAARWSWGIVSPTAGHVHIVPHSLMIASGWLMILLSLGVVWRKRHKWMPNSVSSPAAVGS